MTTPFDKLLKAVDGCVDEETNEAIIIVTEKMANKLCSLVKACIKWENVLVNSSFDDRDKSISKIADIRYELLKEIDYWTEELE